MLPSWSCGVWMLTRCEMPFDVIEPVGRRDLTASRQDGEGIVGDVGFGQPGAQGEGSPAMTAAGSAGP